MKSTFFSRQFRKVLDLNIKVKKNESVLDVLADIPVGMAYWSALWVTFGAHALEKAWNHKIDSIEEAIEYYKEMKEFEEEQNEVNKTTSG